MPYENGIHESYFFLLTAHVDIFGDGSCKDGLQALIARHGLEHCITIQPPTTQIYDEYQRSDFYVLSSRHEGLGMVILEAMSCGIPCVAFNPNRSLGPISSGDVKVFSCSPESKECLPLIHGSHET